MEDDSRDVERPPGRRDCDEDDCTRPHYARGWCPLHYKRWYRTGSPLGGAPVATCSVASCDRQAKSRGWCHAHDQRWRNHGDVLADIPLQAPGRCRAPGCGRPSHARGWCQAHYRRVLASGDAREDEPIRIVSGAGWLSHGYWFVPVDDADRHLASGAASMSEHRLRMARHLDRPLEPDETVHHRNGVRTDNRLENLELWSSAHPHGQRIEDKVRFALEMLQRYAPWALVGDGHRDDETPPSTDGRASKRTPDGI